MPSLLIFSRNDFGVITYPTGCVCLALPSPRHASPGCAPKGRLPARQWGPAARVHLGTLWQGWLGPNDRSACGRCLLLRIAGQSMRKLLRSDARFLVVLRGRAWEA